MQVIARLVQEREAGAPFGPTLLVAPTSVIGNWQKEIEKLRPASGDLDSSWPRAGAGRRGLRTARRRARRWSSPPTPWRAGTRRCFTALDWHRVVLDEAQNIKNPQAAQTKAIIKLRARHRLALTGTPVENRLMDLWSIFHFANPGYLDTQARFRRRFELPVQRDNDPVQTATLKRLVEPFILRRVKTDKAIIKDLPDKLEAIQYCNLSTRAGGPLRDGGARGGARAGGEGRHRATGADALDPDAAQADLQPPGAVSPGRQPLHRGALAQAASACRRCSKRSWPRATAC